jgi:hypothetical protein
MQSIELPPLDTFQVSETVLPVLKALMEQYSDQHSRTKKDIASLRSSWTCLASVAPGDHAPFLKQFWNILAALYYSQLYHCRLLLQT